MSLWIMAPHYTRNKQRVSIYRVNLDSRQKCSLVALQSGMYVNEKCACGLKQQSQLERKSLWPTIHGHQYEQRAIGVQFMGCTSTRVGDEFVRNTKPRDT